MKIKTDPSIKQFSGRLKKSKLVFLAPDGKRCTSARSYRKPAHTSGNDLFATKSNLIRSVLSGCQEGFVIDFDTYLLRYNTLQVPSDHLVNSRSSLFQAACFRAAAARAFDLLTLSLDTFQNLIDGLTVYDLVRTAGMPLLSFSASDLDAPFLEWGPDLFNWQDVSTNGIIPYWAQDTCSVDSEKFAFPPNSVYIGDIMGWCFDVPLPFSVSAGDRFKIEFYIDAYIQYLQLCCNPVVVDPSWQSFSFRSVEVQCSTSHSNPVLMIRSNATSGVRESWFQDLKIYKHV